MQTDDAQAQEISPRRQRPGPLPQLADAIAATASELLGLAVGEGGITLERPPQADLGDYSTNAALVLAGAARQPPRELAQRIGEGLQQRLQARIERFEVAGPGFLNIFLNDAWHVDALRSVLAAGERFGAGGASTAERILIEFVSANPTGPMHVGHARNAAYGDALGRLLSFHGHDVSREFYVNDAGSQILKLGESIQALASGREPPEGGYLGEYVQQLASALASDDRLTAAELGRRAVEVMIAEIKGSLARFNLLDYEHWQYESELHEVQGALIGREGTPVSPVQHALELLEDKGMTYRSEGALWLRTSELGDDKDRVLVRSNGEHTYFASDIAYHQRKRERGFHRQIDVWGADHHGYVPRMKAAYKALGGDPQHIEMLIMQLVHLLRDGQRAQMSKRAGEFVTLDDLVQEIGVDAARWYLLSRSHDTTIDLDLDLAVKQSSENPVYYVQYAHARIASMLAKAPAGLLGQALQRLACTDLQDAPPFALHPSERALVKLLLQFPSEVAEAAHRRAPHRIASYALELAQRFTAFYRDCRVLGAEPTAAQDLRLGLSSTTQAVLARALGLLGVGAPQSM